MAREIGLTTERLGQTMNKAILVGYVGQDPTTGDGKTNWARFSVAARDGKDSTFWGNCVAFGKTAELVASYVGKGDLIGIEGRLSSGSYTDNNGIKHKTTSIVVDRLHFFSNKSKEESGAVRFHDDDIPF